MSFEIFGQQDRMKVVVSRYWEHPEITVNVTRDEITVMCDLDEFLKALITEIVDSAVSVPPQTLGHRVRNFFTQEKIYSIDEKICEAAIKVVEKLKDATSQA